MELEGLNSQLATCASSNYANCWQLEQLLFSSRSAYKDVDAAADSDLRVEFGVLQAQVQAISDKIATLPVQGERHDEAGCIP